MRALASSLLLLSLLAAPTQAANSCIHRNDILSWKSASDRVLMLESGTHQRVTLRLSPGCDKVGIYDQILISSPITSDVQCVSVGDRVVTMWAGERGICHVQAIRPAPRWL
jgi:hypothetical protein